MYKGYAVISAQQWGEWKPYIENGQAAEKAAKELRKETEKYDEAAKNANVISLKKENEKLKEENEGYSRELNDVKDTLNSMADYMSGISLDGGKTNLLMQYQKAFEEKMKEAEKEKEEEKEEER